MLQAICQSEALGSRFALRGSAVSDGTPSPDSSRENPGVDRVVNVLNSHKEQPMNDRFPARREFLRTGGRRRVSRWCCSLVAGCLQRRSS